MIKIRSAAVRSYIEDASGSLTSFDRSTLIITAHKPLSIAQHLGFVVARAAAHIQSMGGIKSNAIWRSTISWPWKTGNPFGDGGFTEEAIQSA
jgi:hypothetical protein